MNESDVKNLIQSELHKTQYQVPPVPFHTHNGIDAPMVAGQIRIQGRSHKTGNQNISNTTTTKIQYNVNDFADNLTWDSTNFRFIAPLQGRYLVNATLYYSAPVSAANYQMFIYKNGAEYTRNILNGGSNPTVLTPMIADIVPLTIGDYVEIYTRQDSGITEATTDINPSASRFSICLV